MLETLTCQTCGVVWTRELAKGRKPKLCADCKDDPQQLKRQKELSEEEKKEKAVQRVFALEERLAARGLHVGQQDVLADIKQRLAALEEKVELLEKYPNARSKANM